MTATLNYALREGLEFGTDEMGQANLKMILDFTYETWFDTLRVAALALEQGLTDTSFISIEILCQMVFEQLKQQDKDAADIWNKGWVQIIKDGTFIGHFLTSWKNIVLVDQQSLDESDCIADVLLTMDLEALRIAAKMQEARS